MDIKYPFPIHANFGIAAPRFANEEDAKLFMECLASSSQFPPEKWIYPYAVIEGKAVINPAYDQAPFELQYRYEKVDNTLVNVT